MVPLVLAHKGAKGLRFSFGPLGVRVSLGFWVSGRGFTVWVHATERFLLMLQLPVLIWMGLAMWVKDFNEH